MPHCEIEVLAPEPQPDVQADGIFQPFFASKSETTRIKRTQTIAKQRKWSLYFEEWGCLHCWQKAGRHLGCGHCELCHYKVTGRLKRRHRNWNLYFEAYGCAHCQQKTHPHTGCGLCAICYGNVASRLQTVIENTDRKTRKQMPPTMDATKLARKALAPSIRKLGGLTKFLEGERLALP